MTYWRIIEANAAMRREAAFQRWRESRYHDTVAHDEFVAMFVAANAAAAQARRIGT